MKLLPLLLLPLAACAPHVYVKEPYHVQMDRDHRAFVLVFDPRVGAHGDDNGSGSASSDAVSDDSNGDGSDE